MDKEGTKQVNITSSIIPQHEPDVLTPACLSHSTEVVYSKQGTRGHTAGRGGVCVCVCARVGEYKAESVCVFVSVLFLGRECVCIHNV